MENNEEEDEDDEDEDEEDGFEIICAVRRDKGEV